LFLQQVFQTPRLRVKKTTRRLVAKTAKLWRAGVLWETTPGALARRNALQTIKNLSAPMTDARETTRELVLLFVTHIRCDLLVRLLTSNRAITRTASARLNALTQRKRLLSVATRVVQVRTASVQLYDSPFPFFKFF
jgi:hypothetical protein